MRFRLRTLMILVVFASIVSLVLSFAYRANQSIRNAYAVWWVADMCVEHMEANDGDWPRGWDDLRDDYQTCVDRSGHAWTFDELSSRVDVDWEADPKQMLPLLEKADQQLIWLRDGSTTHWEGREPNQIILDYLRSRPIPKK